MIRILKRRIEKIHNIKANKTLNSQLSESSYDKQEELKLILDDMNVDDDFSEVIEEINKWAGGEPIATEKEIEKRLKIGSKGL